MIRIGWASTYQALILPTVANVFAVYIFRQFFLAFPKELEDAAIVDGAGRVPDLLPHRPAARPRAR